MAVTYQLPSIALRFDNAPLERRFREELQERHRRQNRLAAVFGVLAYALFAGLDHAVGGAHWHELWLIRLGITLPLLAVLLSGLLVPAIGGRYAGPLVAGALMIAGLGIVAMNACLPANAENLYFTGLMLVILYAHTFFRVDFRWPTLATILLFFVYLGTAVFIRPIPPAHLAASVSFYLSITGIMAYTGWFLERQQRQAFLLQHQLRLQAHTDELTGLANRRAFLRHLEDEWRRALRTGARLSLLLVDLDHLKQINDMGGHAAGDQALRQLAAALKGQARRPGDLAARLGGDEFALFLSGASQRHAYRIAKQLAQGLGSLPAQDDRPGRALTASVGLATTAPSPATSQEDLLRAADKALYEAKAGGRARAVYRVLR